QARGALLLSRGLEPRLQRPTGTLCAADARVQEVRRRTPRSLRGRSLEPSGVFEGSQPELPAPLRLRPERGDLQDLRGLHRAQRRIGAGALRGRSEGNHPMELPLAGRCQPGSGRNSFRARETQITRLERLTMAKQDYQPPRLT